MPIDYDHQIDLAAGSGGTAPAAGWIKGLQQRANGIWGLVEWTPRASEHLSKLEYRYLSPVFEHSAKGEITCLLRASLTNNPNLDQLTALASQEEPMNFFEQVRTLLALPEDADETTVLEQVKKLLTAKHAVDPTQFVPIGDFERTVAELNRVNRGISLQAATDHVVSNINGGKLPPFLKDWGISLCTANKPAFDSFIERAGGKLFNMIFRPSGASAAPPPSMHNASNLTDEERLVASRMGLTEDEFLKNKTHSGQEF